MSVRQSHMSLGEIIVNYPSQNPYQNPYQAPTFGAVPAIFAEEDARAAFIRRTYAHLFGAILLFVAFEAAVFDSAGDVPRIHERFLIYLVPLFLVGLFAAFRAPAEQASARVYLVAAAITVLLVFAIPFGTVVNFTLGFDSPSLNPFARVVRNRLVPMSHATLFALWVSATLSLLYVYLRMRLRSIVLLVLLGFLFVSVLARSRIQQVSAYPRSLLRANR